MITTNLTFDPTGWLEINYIQTDGDTSLTLQSTSYHPTQLELIHADCAKHGMTIEGADAEIIANWVADYVPPAPAKAEAPTVVTIRQARLALLAAGLLDDIDAAVHAAGRAAQIEWEYATEVRRDHALIAAMAATNNLTDDEIDALFTAAASM